MQIDNDDLTKSERARALHYIKTLIEVAREPFLILDENLRVVIANVSFYETFRVNMKETEGNFVYDLGNRQWNIPELKKLLEDILPKKKLFKDYKVTHNFETIGRKTIAMNAHQVDSVKLIILCFEDITEKKTA